MSAAAKEIPLADPTLLEPISPEMPCGPDLEARDDAPFLDYYFEAESRLPERYFTPGLAADGQEDRLFDPRTVDLRSETAAIDALLRRSRDLRLLSLLARFRILAGRLDLFAEALENIAALMARWPAELHPQGPERRAAIEALNAQPSSVMPLLHVPLLPNADVTLRRHMVATGKAAPRASEADLVGADLLGPLRADANLAALTTTHDRLQRATQALAAIRRLAAEDPHGAFRPDLGALIAALDDMQAMIAAARPDLQARDGVDESADVRADDRHAAAETPPEQQRVLVGSAAARSVQDRATAVAALAASAEWLAMHEPSSPAVMLVAQARQLVGKPLVEALEILMPGKAGAAVLRLGQAQGFVLPMDRMRALTQTGLGDSGPDQPAAGEILPINHRGDVVATLLAVESHFSTAEPASPVPLLLSKARDMLNKRFDAIVAEMLASDEQKGNS